MVKTYISLYKSNRFKLKLFELFLNLDLEKNVIEVLKFGNEVSTVGLLRGEIGPNLMEKSLSPIILLLEIWKKRSIKIYDHGYASHPC